MKIKRIKIAASLRLIFCVRGDVFRGAVLALLLLFPGAAAHAACTNPAGAAGKMVYNRDWRVMQYCDDTVWRTMGRLTYNPTNAMFDGINDYLLRGADLTANADSKSATGSFWVRRNGGFGIKQVIYSNTGPRFEISLDTSNSLRFEAGSATATDRLVAIVTSPSLNNNLWHHVMWSFDLDNAANRAVYIDGDPATVTWSTYSNAANVDFTVANHSIGALVGGGNKLDADLADFWMELGAYTDLSVAANRAKFLTAAGLPVYLGSNGAGGPTGAAPDIFLSGAIASWATNDGTGGGFTVTGAITASSFDVVEEGLVLPSAVTYTSAGQYSYTVPNDCGSVEIQAYGGGGAGSNDRGGSGGGGTSLVRKNSNAALLAAGGGGGGGGGQDSGTSRGGGGGFAKAIVAVTPGEQLDIWVGGGGVRNSGDNGGAGGGTAPNNGANGGGRNNSGVSSTNGGGGGCGSRGGAGGSSTNYGGGGGRGDDGCNTVGSGGTGGGLSGSGDHGGGGGGFGDLVIAGTSGGAAANDGPGFGGNAANGGAGKVVVIARCSCTSPSGFQGMLLYNSSSNVPMFCDGKTWYSLGRAGSGGPGCTNPSASGGKMAYNVAARVIQYCDGSVWRATSPIP